MQLLPQTTELFDKLIISHLIKKFTASWSPDFISMFASGPYSNLDAFSPRLLIRFLVLSFKTILLASALFPSDTFHSKFLLKPSHVFFISIRVAWSAHTSLVWAYSQFVLTPRRTTSSPQSATRFPIRVSQRADPWAVSYFQQF